MIAERIAQEMIKWGLRGTRFSKIEPVFPAELDGIGWYIHIPFCRRLCPYCGFRSLPYSQSKVASYIDAVKKEIQIYRDKLGKIKIGDVYFGGGTPSLTWREILETVEYLRSKFEVEGKLGLEANPEDINETMCEALKQGSMSKISLGVQSLDSDILKTMQRGYDAKAVLEAIELLLNKGFYVSVDLMHGLPKQSISSLLRDLRMVVEAGVHQVSHYPLILFPYTKWYREVQSGNIPLTSHLEKNMFYAICDFLTANGYKQVSCWDFIRDEAGMQYITCTRDENIGVGISAYTKIKNLFYVNTFSLEEYIKSVKSGLPIATGTIMPLNQAMKRWFMMGLYKLKVDKADFEKRFSVPIERAIGKHLLILKLLNIIQEHPNYIEVTRRGLYWVSFMTKIFMLTFPSRYIQECLRAPWPNAFEI
ncbi:MAG: coproporphyrinogen-III oxidase family protein [Methanocellales archaeon]